MDDFFITLISFIQALKDFFYSGAQTYVKSVK